MFRLLLLVMFVLVHSTDLRGQNKSKLILDCDTANEQDDLYAIIRMLNQDKFEVVALNSTQWVHYLGAPDSLEASQRDNEDMLRLSERTDIPALRGSTEPMGKPWGGSEPKDSEAAQFIIKTVRDLPDGEMIYVVCTGATTNLASAIALAPEIAPRIKLYLMGFQYEDEAGVWNKSEFNVRRDLNAADFVLNQSDLEVHIMSATLSKSYRFDRADTFRRLESLGEIGAYFKAKWTEKYSDFDRWTMWDLALVQAMIRPELAREHQVATPPENTQRTVWVYHAIDVEAMTADFWAAMDESDAKQK